MAAKTKAIMRVCAICTPQDAAATRPPRSARMAQHQHQCDADDSEIRPVVDQGEAADTQRRDAVDAVVAAEQVEIGNDIDQGDVHRERA
jgi:hypothetical protein